MLRIVTFSALGVYWIALFVGTHLPHGVRGLGSVNDKLLHFGAYAGLAFLLAATLTTMRMRHGALLVPMVVAAIYGCVDELTQMAIPGRQADVADWAADVFGAGLGVFAFGLLSLATARYFSSRSTIQREAVTKSAA
ncbi:MAG: VanZ family protein [Planctomycetes bacterium]|nr:VanZ family protein [Planctomycetota bacterium]